MEREKTFSFGKQTRTFYTLHILRPWATEQWLSWTRLTIPAGGGAGHIRWSEVNTFLTLSWTEWLTSGGTRRRTTNSCMKRLKIYSVEESLERFHLIRNDATAPAASLCVCVCFKETSLWRQKATKVSRFHFISKCVMDRKQILQTTTKITFF